MLHSFDPLSAAQYRVTAFGDLTDEDLMQSIQHGDESALAELGQRHRGLIRSVISKTLNNEADVDDLEQECLLEVWRHAANYNSEKGNALSWIITLARRRSIDRVRRKVAYGRAQERLCEEVAANPEMFQPSTAEEVAQSDCGQVIAALISRLPVRQQEVVRLTFYHQMSQRQIAAQTGIPLGTIKTRIELALRKLRDAVRANGELHDEISMAA